MTEQVKAPPEERAMLDYRASPVGTKTEGMPMKKETQEIRLKKAEVKKFRRGRGGKNGRSPRRIRKAA